MKGALYAILLAAGLSLTSAASLKITVVFDKPVYRMGDALQVDITYRNVSAEPLRILAKERYYVAQLLSINRISDNKKGDYVLPIGEPVFDFEQLLQYVVLLDPGDSVTRRYKAIVQATLPPGYADRTHGVYLVFAGSAIRLPGFGKYSVVSGYDQRKGDPFDQDIPGEPRLWAGKASSEAVLVTIKRK